MMTPRTFGPALLLSAIAALAGAQDYPPTTTTIPLSTPAMKPSFSPLAQFPDVGRIQRDLETQVAFGPRIPGTPEHAMQIQWMAEELQKAGFEVEYWQGPRWTPTLTGEEVGITNVVGRWRTERRRKIAVSAHFDTRPFSSAAKSVVDYNTPVPGANDGASGVAGVLEIARAIQAHPPTNVGIIIMLHDCEDLGVNPGVQTNDSLQEYARGALEMSKTWKPEDRYEAGVNLDLIGEKAAPLFRVEEYSRRKVPALVEEFWTLGKSFYPELFSAESGGFVTDDHLPYLFAGLPHFNVIDLEYAQWHTPQDDLSAVSAETVRKVVNVTLEFIARRDRPPAEKP